MAGTVAQGRSTSKLDLLLRGQLQQAPPSAGSGQLAFSDFSFLLETLGDLDETGLGKTWAGPCEARGRTVEPGELAEDQHGLTPASQPPDPEGPGLWAGRGGRGSRCVVA